MRDTTAHSSRSLLSAFFLAALAACGSSEADVATDTIETSNLTANTRGQLSAVIRSGACLDVVGRSTQSDTGVQLWDCHGAVNQTWQITDKGVAVYGTLCLAPAGKQNGATVKVYTCNTGDDKQAWRVSGDQLINTSTNKCLDVRDGNSANGARLQLWECDSNNRNQRFKMAGTGVESAPAPTPTPSSGGSTGTGKVDAAVNSSVNFSDWGINGGFTAMPLGELLAKHPQLVYAQQAMLDASAQSNPMIPPQLLVAICLQESSGGLNVGSYGGPFQFTDDRAWNAYGPKGGDRNNMNDAAKGAANYIAFLLSQNGGDLNAALRFYNGPIEWGGKPSYQADIQAWMKGVLVYGSGV
jgi:hypothetical protein